MDNIRVKLLGVHGLEAAYRAVKKPYRNEKTDGKKLLHKVTKILKHESVLEHIIFQFDIKGSSRLELQQHMRHRIASPTVESTRYSLKGLVKEIEEINQQDPKEVKDFTYKYTVFTPEMLTPEVNEELQARILGRLLQLKLFSFLYSKYGADEAKYELPECFRTSFVWTINARAMLNFLKLREAEGAHFEIRYIADQMKYLLSNHSEIKNLI